VTKIPKDTPKIYKQATNIIIIKPSLKIDTPKKGIARIDAGTRPIKVLRIAVIDREVIISLIFIGDANKLLKFLLQISSKNITL
tara:strand:- start:614 stop:865 length:252 start_codon:yes stop_codon:yes gene_type:complete